MTTETTSHKCGCGCGDECEFDCTPVCCYTNCADPRCHHYIIEHGFGEPQKIVYSKDHPEEVGQVFNNGVGCMNAGCPCDGFAWPDKISQAVRDSYCKVETAGVDPLEGK